MTATRRGACPSLATPMPTGDGLLVRLSPVDRALTAAALEGLAEAAERFGNGQIEVTARGNLQIRGLSEASVEPFAEALAALDIELTDGVPIEIGALAGLDPTELADPRPVAAAVRRAVAASGLASRLSPKVTVIVDGGGALHLDAVPADIRLSAQPGGHWSIAAGGVETAPRALDPVGGVLKALAEIASRGRQARSREAAASVRPAAEAIGVHALRDGSRALGVGLAFGRTGAPALRDLARIAGRDFRLAPGRALLILGIEPPAIEALSGQARQLGFIVDADDPRRSVAACPGCPACASGEIPARELAEQIVRDAAPLLDGSMTLHVSGCAKGCAHPRPAPLALVGIDGACELALDGMPVVRMPAATATRGLALLADLVAGERVAGETALSCLARLGSGRVTHVLRGHSHV